MTLNEILTWGNKNFIRAKLYFGHGTDNAWDEAVWLAFHVLNLPYDADRSVLLTELTAVQISQIKALYQQRIAKRIPAAYLLNEAWFCGLPFYVDHRVLIPRSPIAELIAKKFQPFSKATVVKAILDLCTGSACIAIACAKVFAEAKIDAVDISTSALAVAQINVAKYQLKKQVNLIESDLFDALPRKKYDIIVSNPPYVDAKAMATLPQEYRLEPSIALAAGKNGLLLVDKILRLAKEYFTPLGIIIVEVGNSAEALKKNYPSLPFIWLKLANREKDKTAEVFLLHQRDL
jgi:ribosomal protein L3 glutamine methyltransferase